ncbi:MAG: IS1595 family transposase [Candidatus Ozemobacteraceae bacterium]
MSVKALFPMPDFPKDLPEFERRFATEEACAEYLKEQRWPDGFLCPACRHPHGWTNQRGAIECKACGHQTSLTADTILHGTRHPLRLWFQAMWWVCTQKTGMSAAGLKRILGFSSMQTAWTWLLKLRQAMVRLEREPLTGRVEVDDAWLGGEPPTSEKGWRGARLAVGVELDLEDGSLGRIRLQDITPAPERLMIAFVRQEVLPGSILETDAWPGFTTLDRDGYSHRVISETDDPARSLPQVRRMVTLVRRWLLGTHQGRVERHHLQSYLDEFVFRFNRRKSPHVGLLFQRLLSQGARVKARPYKTWAERGKKAPSHNMSEVEKPAKK